MFVLMLLLLAIMIGRTGKMSYKTSNAFGELIVILIVAILLYNLILIFYYTIAIMADFGNSDDFKEKYIQFGSYNKKGN